MRARQFAGHSHRAERIPHTGEPVCCHEQVEVARAPPGKDSMSSVEQITAVVREYVSRLSTGTSADIAALTPTTPLWKTP
ncbi:hypothetical protein [Nocardia sputi]|uniref:hypothetical protein n=1 Tax=Nocardia TaxID=1817 RepID=UPI0034E298B2